MENFSTNKKIALGAAIAMLLSCFLPLSAFETTAFFGVSISKSFSMWDAANGIDGVGGKAIHYLYFLLAGGAIYLVWNDNFKIARIVFGSFLLLFIIQVITGVSYKEMTESITNKGLEIFQDFSLEKANDLSNDIADQKEPDYISKDVFGHAKIGLWLLLASCISGIVYTTKEEAELKS